MKSHLYLFVALFLCTLPVFGKGQKKSYLEPATKAKAEWETTKTERDKRNPDDILLLHPDKEMVPRLAQYKWRMPAWKVPVKPQPSFVMLCFTDLHSCSNELRRIMSFYNYYEEYFDAVVSAGDALHHWGLDDSFWKEDGASKVLPVLGNHELFVGKEGTREVNGEKLKVWSTPSFSQKEGYERYFKPYLNDTKFTGIEEGKCYWYKDFPEVNIRLIGLDPFHWREKIRLENGKSVRTYPDGEKTDKGEQERWFEKTLSDAKDKKLSVICITHCPDTKSIEQIECPFTAIYQPDHKKNMQKGMVEAVDRFIVNGGDFVTWICGHLHYDVLSVIKAEHSDQLQIALDKATMSHSEQMKFKNTVSEDLFTIIAADPRVGFITFHRIGSDYDSYGRHIGTLVYDYRNKRVISHD